jgi:hypothetical protein
VLDVGEFRALTATLTPQTTSGRGQTNHRIELTNEGNVVEPVQLKASDPAGRIRFSLPAGELPVPPGSQHIDMSVRPPMRFLGRSVSQPFQVLATPRPPLPAVRLDGTREVVPLIAGWVPKVVAGLVTLGVAAAAFLLIAKPFDKVGSTGTSTAATPATTIALSGLPTGSPGASPSDGAGPGGSPSASASASSAAAMNTPWVVVDAAGGMTSNNGVAAVTPQGTGRFEVTFTRRVDGCVHLATVAASGGQAVPDNGLVFTAGGSNRNSVLVQTRSIDGTPAAHPFHLQVRCAVGDTAVVVGDRAVRGTDQPKVRQTGKGQWEIRFDRDIRDCSYVATIGDPDTEDPPTGLVNVGTGRQDAAAILVETRIRDGIRTDMPFHLQTRCSGLFVVVDADGETPSGAGVDAVRHPGPGTWEVDFSRGDVSRCSYAAALGTADGDPADGGGVVYAASGPNPATVQIHTHRLNTATGRTELGDAPFHLQVVC